MSRLFNTISIEISSLCNRKCWFCPNAIHNRPDVQMSWGLITGILGELKDLDYSGRVEFYIYNEPMRDERLLNIVSLFRKELPKACLMIATNGDYVKSSKQFKELYDAGLNQLQVNIYSDKRRFEQIGTMLDEIDCEPGNIYLKCSPKKRLYSLEAKYNITKSSASIGRFQLNNRSGNVPDLSVVPEPLQKVCVRPFRYMQINWKGEAILCCNDYYATVIVGDIYANTLQEIWFDSYKLNGYRKSLLQKHRGLSLCKQCNFAGGAYTHLCAKDWPELVEQAKPDTKRLF